MAQYQSAHHFTLNHAGETNTGTQSGGATHPIQDAQGVIEGTVAHPPPTQVSAAKEAGESAGIPPKISHSRINFNPTHTCAVCKVTCQNNYALEKHASKKHHKAFLCTCSIRFVRLATLKRHIKAQDGLKYHCIYCDDNKCFAREDKLIDHLRASHKFGDKAIAQFRSQARSQPNGEGHTSSAVVTTGTSLTFSTSASSEAAPGDIVGQVGYCSGVLAGPSGGFDGGIADFPMFSAAEIQPFESVEDYSWLGAAADFADFDFSGVGFTGVDGNPDMSGMGNDI